MMNIDKENEKLPEGTEPRENTELCCEPAEDTELCYEPAEDTDSCCEPADEASWEYTPKTRFEAVLYTVYKNETLTEILKISSYAIVAFTVYSFFVTLISLAPTDVTSLAKLLLITGIPFILVSVLRLFVDAPRPYELYEFYKKRPKSKRGRSFPSRHVFSAFVIAVVCIPYNAALGILLLFLGAILAVFRVLCGIHFVRDVAAGALIGIISGAVGLLII